MGDAMVVVRSEKEDDGVVYVTLRLEPVFLRPIVYEPSHLATGLLPQARRSPKRRFLWKYHLASTRGWSPSSVRGWRKKRAVANHRRRCMEEAQWQTRT